jgi:hypothetical protein
MALPQKFETELYTKYFMHRQQARHDGANLNSRTLILFYQDVCNLLGGKPDDFSYMNLAQQDTYSLMPPYSYTWDMYHAPNGVAFIELKGSISDRDPDTGLLFGDYAPDDPGNCGLDTLTITLWPPDKALEAQIEALTAKPEYGTAFELSHRP